MHSLSKTKLDMIDVPGSDSFRSLWSRPPEHVTDEVRWSHLIGARPSIARTALCFDKGRQIHAGKAAGLTLLRGLACDIYM